MQETIKEYTTTLNLFCEIPWYLLQADFHQIPLTNRQDHHWREHCWLTQADLHRLPHDCIVCCYDRIVYVYRLWQNYEQNTTLDRLQQRICRSTDWLKNTGSGRTNILWFLADRCHATFGCCHNMSSVVVCLSVTRVYCDKTAEARIMQFSLKCSPMPFR